MDFCIAGLIPQIFQLEAQIM